jgi:hypothetical protein
MKKQTYDLEERLIEYLLTIMKLVENKHKLFGIEYFFIRRWTFDVSRHGRD